MSISDSAGDSTPEPVKPKRILRPLTPIQWQQARVMFETGANNITQTHIAAVFNTSLSSVQKRSAVEKWSKGAQFIADTRKQMIIASGEAMTKAVDTAAQQMAARITKELQPWIEKEKRSHIQRAIKRSKRAMKRLDRVAEGYQVFDAKAGELVNCSTTPKDEMNIAQAEDKYDGIIRRNLGMSDSGGLSGSLSLNILTGSAAIQVNTAQPEQ